MKSILIPMEKYNRLLTSSIKQYGSGYASDTSKTMSVPRTGSAHVLKPPPGIPLRGSKQKPIFQWKSL